MAAAISASALLLGALAERLRRAGVSTEAFLAGTLGLSMVSQLAMLLGVPISSHVLFAVIASAGSAKCETKRFKHAPSTSEHRRNASSIAAVERSVCTTTSNVRDNPYDSSSSENTGARSPFSACWWASDWVSMVSSRGG